MHMNVTVFGATGRVGSSQVVDQLRSRGHTVTAYARNPSKVPSTWGEDVTVVVGELSDAAAIDRAVQGADAVVSALGPSLSRKATGLPLIEGSHLLRSEYAIECVSELEGVGAAAGCPSCDRIPLVPGRQAAGPRAPRWAADPG
jgi:uncharacterized protein YbjT (DUF2867 family)